MLSLGGTAAHLQNVDPNHVYQQEAQRLRQRSNELTPFGRLPAEIVMRLIHVFRDSYVPSYGAVSMVVTLNRFLHTCRRVYLLAASLPELWTRVDLVSHPQWLKVCQERAGGTPLEVKASMNIHAQMTAYDIHSLFSHATRLSCNPKTNHLPTYIEFFDRPAPRLRSLDISGTFMTRSEFTLTPGLLGGMCANLTTLSLDRIQLQGAPPMPSLVAISFGDLETTFAAWYRIVAQAPGLLHLSMDSVTLLHDGSDDYVTAIPLDIPHLRTLSLNQGADQKFPFLRVVPDPAYRLILERGLEDPPIWAGEGEEDNLVPARVRSFWTKVTGSAQPPETRLSINTTTDFHLINQERWDDHLSYTLTTSMGSALILNGEPDAAFCWHTECEVTEPHPFLDSVTKLLISAKGGRLHLGHIDRLDIDLFHNIQHIEIEGAYSVDGTWEQYGVPDVTEFTKWLIDVKNAGRRLPDLTICDGCHPQLRVLADFLYQHGVVEQIYWDD
jgi:hypothetical protein